MQRSEMSVEVQSGTGRGERRRKKGCRNDWHVSSHQLGCKDEEMKIWVRLLHPCVGSGGGESSQAGF